VAINALPYSQHGEISDSFVDVRANPTMQKMWHSADGLTQKLLSNLPLCLDAVTGL
jgi:hypothetical protein